MEEIEQGDNSRTTHPALRAQSLMRANVSLSSPILHAPRGSAACGS